MTYSKLSDGQIAALEKNGCSCEDWSRVTAGAGFNPSRVEQTVFQGDVAIGSTGGAIESSDGIVRQCGIYRARLRNTKVGDCCSISNVNGWLSNLDIEDGVCIENAGTIACVGETAFGNGHEVSVLNEGGGRELRITSETSAQIAYLTVLYRDRKPLIENLNALALKSAAKMRSSRMRIECGASIRNVSEIINVHIGSYSIIDGAADLREGTIVSSKEAVTMIGSGVIARNFIIQQGASVQEGAMVFASLVGEGARVGKQFSCENSLLFANCEGFHSEVCSVFAGPYTVTHHRSTLLIGGMFSFYNAGSGTNQSNHLYKLGPLHQGIMERGSKTGSSSYLLWPSRVGAFSVVIGSHYAHFDTTDFPFSYIYDKDGKSIIVPGMNFFMAGTMRDSDKWPARDRRTNAKKLDFISFAMLSPYSVRKMIEGRAILLDLNEKSPSDQLYVTWKGISISRQILKACSRYYKIAVDKYFGDVLLARITGKPASAVRSALKPVPGADDGTGEWIDAGGLLCSKNRLEGLLTAIESGSIATQQALYDEFLKIHGAYNDDEWNWVLGAYKKVYDEDLPGASKEAMAALLERWRDAYLEVLKSTLTDIRKEFEGNVRIGFGIDGNRDDDFAAVRGSFETNPFVKKLQAEMEAVDSKFDTAMALIASLEG